MIVYYQRGFTSCVGLC